MRRPLAVSLVLACAVFSARAQDTTRFTHADTLRGSIGPARAWWDVTFYDLHVKVHPADSSIEGANIITYRAVESGQEMQIDLQAPMVLDSVIQFAKKQKFRRDSNAYFVTLEHWQKGGDVRALGVFFHGKPRVGKRLPWDGGFAWQKDSLGRPWIATANEGLGASVWWPLKDHLADEPDSQRIMISVPDSLMDVSNGRLRGVTAPYPGMVTLEWFVTNPINTYDVAINIGHYGHFADTLRGEGGQLTLDYWPLDYHMDAAKRQFAQVTPMLQCFEHWFGPYPWYADGYKLVETPHLGMEHQSAVAYGNHYQNGYLGRDLSKTGIGLQWDYIIVHESAHEWWGNSISVKDHADMWVHEAFAYYAEGIYTECSLSKTAGEAYLIGSRGNIKNDRPIVGPYGVNRSGSGDMYPKGANMLNMIRAVIDDDAKWRAILRGLQRTFRHQTVTGQQVEDYISKESGIDFAPVFAQYLTTTMIPVFEYKVSGQWLSYRWANVVPGFRMPVEVNIPGLGTRWLKADESWQQQPLGSVKATEVFVSENFYVTAKNVTAASGEVPVKK